MFDFTGVKLERLVIHKCGNKFRNEGTIVSDGLNHLKDDTIRDLLLKYFLSAFKEELFYTFHHESNLNFNEINSYISTIFTNKEDLYDQSINILKHLYEKSTHPNIKAGELYIAYFTNCLSDDVSTSAIGIFKSESKETYLKISEKNSGFQINYEKGININKLDKGCLIFNQNKENGYKVSIVDTTNSNEAVYWKNDFLNIKPLNDNRFNTKSYLNLCKDFSKTIYTNSESKKNQVQFLNDTINYFNNNDEFNMENFTSSIIKEPKFVEEFNSYAQSYMEKEKTDLKSNFIISDDTVKKYKKMFSNIIRLDTKIEIKFTQTDINQSKYIEKGFDQEKGMNFYKLYFNDEK